MPSNNSQTGIVQQAPKKWPLLRGVNEFLTLPVTSVVLVLLGPIGTRAAAVLVTDMRPRSAPPPGDGAGDGEGRGGTDIVTSDRKKRRPHVTGHVRDV